MGEALSVGSVQWKSCKNAEGHDKRSLKCFEYIVRRSWDFEKAASEGLTEKEENHIGN